MTWDYVQIDESNRDAFDRVLPEHMDFAGKRTVIGAVSPEGDVLGAVSYTLMNFQYEIDWIYVEPQMRRQKIGIGLIEAVLGTVMNTELFPVVARFEFEEDDRELHTFFLACKYLDTSYSHERYYVTSDDIRTSGSLHKPAASEIRIENFFEKTEPEQKKILSRLAVEETYVVDDYVRWKEQCIPQLCRCIFVKNNLVDLIFIQKLPDGNLELAYLYGKYPKGLFDLLSQTVSDMEALFPNATLSFDAMNEESMKLADHLFPKAKTVHIYEAGF